MAATDDILSWNIYTIEQATCLTLTVIEALNAVVQKLCGARGSYEEVGMTIL